MRKQRAVAEKEPVAGMVGTVREEDEEVVRLCHVCFAVIW